MEGIDDTFGPFVASTFQDRARLYKTIRGVDINENERQSRTALATNQDVALQATKPKAKTFSNLCAPIVLRNATYAWSAPGPPVVRDVSFELDVGTLTFLVGPVSRGKSSLLEGVLGEIPSSQGFVYVSSPNAAFVDQTPWIQHKRFRNNVLGRSVFDRPWYETVIHACALVSDIAELPRGDLTPVSSAGHSLSGRHKLRFCLARAMLKRPMIVVLDEVTASVDLHTDELMQQVIRESFADCSIIAVAHRLQAIVDLDRFVVMQSGRIKEQGKSQELLAKMGGHFRALWDA